MVDSDNKQGMKKQPQINRTVDFDSTLNMAEIAINYSKEYRIAPVPTVYEVLYLYASGEDEKLKQRVDRVLELDPVLAQREFKIICEEFNAKDSLESDVTSSKLQKGMATILDTIKSHMASSEKFSTSLINAACSIEKHSEREQLQKTIQLLVNENQKMQQTTKDLVGKLKESECQILQIHSKLDEAKKSALRDPLTGIGNRRAFDIEIRNRLDAWNTEGKPSSLAIADLDNFKGINDKFGHIVGDEVIKYFSALLQRNLKGQDFAARIGGEEFAIILPETDIDIACGILDQIRNKLANTELVLTKKKQPIGKMSASFGVAVLQGDDDAEDLIDRADALLYQAKKSGKNQVCGQKKNGTGNNKAA